MSMEIFVLSDRRLASMAEWQRSIDDERLDLVLPTATSIGDLHGFLPVRSGGVETGFECDDHVASDVIGLYRSIEFGRNWAYALAFNWHGLDEGLAAYFAAAAYAKAAGGVVFDPQDGAVLSPQQAFKVADQFKADIPKGKEMLRSMTNARRIS